MPLHTLHIQKFTRDSSGPSGVNVVIRQSARISPHVNAPTAHAPQAVDFKQKSVKYNRNDYSAIRSPSVHVSVPNQV